MLTLKPVNVKLSLSYKIKGSNDVRTNERQINAH